MIGFTEMSVDQGQKFPCNIGGHVFAEEMIEPNNFSGSITASERIFGQIWSLFRISP